MSNEYADPDDERFTILARADDKLVLIEGPTPSGPGDLLTVCNVDGSSRFYGIVTEVSGEGDDRIIRVMEEPA